MHVTAILLAAGKGVRFSRKKIKLFAKIHSSPVLIYSLKALSRHPLVKDIIVVAGASNKQRVAEMVRKYGITKVIQTVKGGKRRQDSVRNGLKAVNNQTDLVLIHDAARPFIDQKLIFSVVLAAKRNGAAIAGVPVKSTIKKGTRLHTVKETLNREHLWEIQTPQVFKRDLILAAYKRFGNAEVTDDSGLVEKLGKKVSIVMGSYKNIKITTPEDLIIAQAYV
jgi:2-C-methyl-D-erythritol 4-phosphate cytidylyltransferase